MEPFLKLVRTTTPCNTINSHTFEVAGRIIGDRRTVHPFVYREDLLALADRALEGDYESVCQIPALYSAGFGVPRSIDTALAWEQVTTFNSKRFLELHRLFHFHVSGKEAKSVFPSLVIPAAHVLNFVHACAVADNPAGRVYPRIGTQVYLVYRNHENSVPTLYAGFYFTPGRIHLVDNANLQLLGIPAFLGQHEDRVIMQPEFFMFDSTPLYIITLNVWGSYAQRFLRTPVPPFSEYKGGASEESYNKRISRILDRVKCLATEVYRWDGLRLRPASVEDTWLQSCGMPANVSPSMDNHKFFSNVGTLLEAYAALDIRPSSFVVRPDLCRKVEIV